MIDKSILIELKEAREKLDGVDWKRGSGHPMNEGIVYRNPDNIKGEMNGFVTYDPAVAEFIVLAKNHMLSLLNSYEELEKRRRNETHLFNPHPDGEECPTFYDGCNCTVENLMHNIERADKAESSRDQMKQTVRTLADALRHLREHTERKGNACKFLAVAKADAALSDPIVKQILEEK